MVVVRSSTLTANEPAFQDEVQRLRQAALATGVLDATAVAAVGAEDLPVSPDRHAVLVPLQLRADTDEIEPLVELVGAADGQGGFDVELVGEATADRDFEELSGQDLREGELLFGLPAALVVLLLVFGSLLAGLVPLLLAVVSIVVALALAALVGQGFALSLFVVNMITGMGLALGIDYALFILSRFREERAGGRPTVDAIGTAGATASRAGAVQRPGLCPGHGGHGAGARHHPAQPGGRGDPGRRGLGGGGADPAAGAAGVAR